MRTNDNDKRDSNIKNNKNVDKIKTITTIIERKTTFLV